MRRVAVVRFPGSNCDADTFRSAAIAGAEPYYVWHRETDLQGADAVMLPGGFSYGDYLRSGAIARFSPIMAAVQKFAKEGGPVLGICNGFQILCEAGLLPGALMRKCNTAEARRRGTEATRFASTRMASACTGVRCFSRMVTTSTDAHVAIAASSTSNGPGAV